MATTRVVQCTNVSPSATLEQLRTLFSHLGKIEDIRIFPKEDTVLPVTSRVCFVKYEDESSVGVAQHLTNTVFIDRALIVVPCLEGEIPEEHKALQLAAPSNSVSGLVAPSGGGLLPTPAQPLLGQIPGLVPSAAGGMDPTYAALGLPQPPPLNNVDPSKIEEIRRTIYVGNLDSSVSYQGFAQTVTAEQLLSFFQGIGEVKYVRMAGDETQPTRFAFVEFTEHASVAKALTYNGVMFAGRPLKINHSNNAIVKPPAKTAEAAQRELAETMKQVRDAQALIQAAIDPETKLSLAAAKQEATKETSLLATKIETKKETEQNFLAPKSPTKKELETPDDRKKRKSRSRSRSRKRSRSRSRSRRSRSRSRSSRRRSRSRDRRRSYSRSRYRSRSRTPPRRRSRSPRKRSPRRRSRTRSPPPPRRRRSRSRSRDRRSRSKDRRRRSKTPPKSYRASRASGSRSRSPPPVRSRRRISRSKSQSPSKSRSRSRSRSGSPRRSKSKPSTRSSATQDKIHKKDKKSRDRERSRERERSSRKHKKDKDRDRKDRSSEDKDSKKSKSKVKRDYDEEEKGYDSDKEKEGGDGEKGEGGMKIQVVMGEGNRPVDDTMDTNLQSMDMDVDTE
ncbi:uncharacterized protein [Amphiura filiformis]|uniref:uncharacterized protein isoform X4 n=1 Tax=Amphiura filiformis TaxID=82378 RepID=UPI003B2226E1